MPGQDQIEGGSRIAVAALNFQVSMEEVVVRLEIRTSLQVQLKWSVCGSKACADMDSESTGVPCYNGKMLQ